MPPTLIAEGKIRVLGETLNSVVYAVAGDSKTGLAKDSLSVLKGGSVWYEGREALGPGKDVDESDESLRKEAAMYKALGKHERILELLGLEESVLGGRAGPGTVPRAWALRLERAPFGSLRDVIFAEGVAHVHRCGIVWGDLSTRNALRFDRWRIKLGDFADSDFLVNYPSDWYGCEVRYCPPGSNRPYRHSVGTLKRECVALGTAIYEITEWKVPYGVQTEVDEDQVEAALANDEWPPISNDNPARGIIQQCWQYAFLSSQHIVGELRSLLCVIGESTS